MIISRFTTTPEIPLCPVGQDKSQGGWPLSRAGTNPLPSGLGYRRAVPRWELSLHGNRSRNLWDGCERSGDRA